MFHLPATIKARFYLAMGVMAFLFIGVGLTSVTAFNWFGRSTSKTLQNSVPAIETGYRTAADAQTIANAIRNFTETSNPARLDHLYKRLTRSLQSLSEQVDILSTRGFSNESEELRHQAEAISNRLDNIYKSRLQELIIESKRRTIMRQGNKALDRIGVAIEPIKNTAGFELNITLYDLINEDREPTETLRRRFFEYDLPNFQYSLEVEASARLAHALLMQSVNENNPRTIAKLEEQFAATSEELKLHLKSFGPDTDIEALKSSIDSLTRLGQDDGNLFNLSMALLDQRSRTTKTIVAAMADASELADAAQKLSTQVSESVASTSQQVGNLNHRGSILVILLTVTGLVLAGVTAWILVGRVLIDRLYKLRNLMEAGQQGVYIRDRIPLQGTDEIAEICRALDFFLNRIEQDVDQLVASERDVRIAKEKAETALAELHLTQESLIQSEKLASIATLVAGVAHELNTPLGAAVGVVSHLNQKIETFGQSLEKGALKKSDVKRFYDTVIEGATILQNNIDRTIKLIERFKQLSSDQPMDQKRMVNLNEFLASCLADREASLRDRDIDVSIYCPDDIDIMTHPVALSQILTTLVMNTLTHAYKPGETGHISILANATAEGVNFVYEDNGRGMQDEELRRIFDPYQASLKDSDKTGMGMLLVHNLVTLRLGGKIHATSAPGKGTRFEIRLPAEIRDRSAA